MYDKQVNIVKQKIEKLSKKAAFKKVPMLKISKDEDLLAKASILGKKNNYRCKTVGTITTKAKLMKMMLKLHLPMKLGT